MNRFFLARMAQPFVVFSERFYPDPFAFAIGLTGLALVLVISLTPTSASEALMIWGQGLTGLLAFMTQLCLILVCGHALAHTDLVHRLIERLAAWPRSASQAYALVVWVAGLASLIAGALGLVVGALIAVAVAREGRAKKLTLHFPLLVASAYSGFMVWHMGYSGTAPLFVATKGHALEAEIGIVPVSLTIFSSWNLALALLTLATTAVVCSLLAPRDVEAIEWQETGRAASASSPRTDGSGHSSTGDRNFGRLVDEGRILSVLLGLLFLAYLAVWFWERGFQLTLDLVNWSFMGLGLVLSRSPRHYATLIVDASRTLGPVLLQYPLYAAVVALMTGTELADMVSRVFVAVATPDTLGFWAFVSGGILNFFIPSGGGQWVVQGPIFIEAARQLAVAPPVVVMGIAYGDQWTNMIQPFWTLPLLAIVGVDARSIMGYCFVVFLAGFAVFGGGLLCLGAG